VSPCCCKTDRILCFSHVTDGSSSPLKRRSLLNLKLIGFFLDVETDKPRPLQLSVAMVQPSALFPFYLLIDLWKWDFM
jgi:hypothetical protein